MPYPAALRLPLSHCVVTRSLRSRVPLPTLTFTAPPPSPDWRRPPYGGSPPLPLICSHYYIGLCPHQIAAVAFDAVASTPHGLVSFSACRPAPPLVLRTPPPLLPAPSLPTPVSLHVSSSCCCHLKARSSDGGPKEARSGKVTSAARRPATATSFIPPGVRWDALVLGFILPYSSTSSLSRLVTPATLISLRDCGGMLPGTRDRL